MYRIVQLSPRQKLWTENSDGGFATPKLDKMKYKFKEIFEKPFMQNRERKFKPIIINMKGKLKSNLKACW